MLPTHQAGEKEDIVETKEPAKPRCKKILANLVLQSSSSSYQQGMKAHPILRKLWQLPPPLAPVRGTTHCDATVDKTAAALPSHKDFGDTTQTPYFENQAETEKSTPNYAATCDLRRSFTYYYCSLLGSKFRPNQAQYTTLSTLLLRGAVIIIIESICARESPTRYRF